MAHNQDPELVPLLAEHAAADESDPKPDPQITIKARKWQTRSPWTIVFLAAVCKFVITLSGMMFLLPFFRILEDGFCHRYYNDKSSDFLDEKECKNKEIQKQLAYFVGWFGLVNAVFGKCSVLN